MTTHELPALPPPDLGLPWRVNAKDGSTHSAGYTADQMREYALLYASTLSPKGAAGEASQWRIEYNNDTGPDDGGFWEWWEVTDGSRAFKADSEDDARMLVAALATPQAAAEVVAWQERWANPRNHPQPSLDDLAWNEVKPAAGQSMDDRLCELRAYTVDGKPCYEVRALYATPQGATAQSNGAAQDSSNAEEVAGFARPSPVAAPPSQWVSVEDRMPEPGLTVLATYQNRLGKTRRICAQWIPARHEESNHEYCDCDEYDEATDTYYLEEGWYERIDNWDEYSRVFVNEGEVEFWQDLPPAPLSVGGGG